MRRVLIVLGVVLAGSVLVYGGTNLALVYGLTQADPYPAFMTDYQPNGARSYDEAERAFSDFVAKTFPIGSDKNKAIAQIRNGGFLVAGSTSETVEFIWKRHNGPCSEQYSIALSGDADGRIARVVGQLRPICL